MQGQNEKISIAEIVSLNQIMELAETLNDTLDEMVWLDSQFGWGKREQIENMGWDIWRISNDLRQLVEEN